MLINKLAENVQIIVTLVKFTDEMGTTAKKFVLTCPIVVKNN